jgi:hypothetical protein
MDALLNQLTLSHAQVFYFILISERQLKWLNIIAF